MRLAQVQGIVAQQLGEGSLQRGGTLGNPIFQLGVERLQRLLQPSALGDVACDRYHLAGAIDPLVQVVTM